jgi:hypothetical protein
MFASVVKVLASLYVAQAAIGFMVGLVWPWLSFFGVF